MRLFLALAYVFPLVLVGCYSPQYRDCAVTCPDGETCPSGYTCASGMCRLPDADGPCPVSDDAGMDAGRLPVNAFYEAVTRATCERGVTCGAYDSVAACLIIANNAQVKAQFDAIVLAEMQGKVEYHEDVALECLNAMAQLGCVRDEPFPVVCKGAITGTLADQQACAFDLECVSGVCTKTAACSTSPDCCAGTCTGNAPPADKNLGQMCSAADRCINSYCDRTLPVPTCTAYQPVGDTCDVFKNECPPGSTCRTTTGTYSCQPLVAPGNLCNASTDCRDLSNVCKDDAGMRKCLVSGLADTSCADPVNNGECHLGLVCNGTTCTPLPGPGESCFATGGCRYDAYCNGGTCDERLPDDAPCDMTVPGGGGNCQSFRCVNSKCEPYPVCT